MQKKILSTHISASVEETREIAQNIASTLKKNDLLAFFGDLGAGKTVCIKAIISHLLNINEKEITSPTFTYMQSYNDNDLNIYHFDLYRLKDAQTFIDIGFDEFIHQGICLIEWAEYIAKFLPSCYIVEIHHIDDGHREIIFSQFTQENF